MIGALPKTLAVGGTEWDIRSDYRNILRMFDALEDQELTDSDKLYVVLTRMYVDFEKMPKELYREAYEQASRFMECHDRTDDKKNPKLINWQKDEYMIFPAINAVAGCEVRALEYMHWWTFLGYFENVDNESLWSFVLSIRQKRAKGKKLEKHEREFFNNNRDLCNIEFRKDVKKPEDKMAEMFAEMLEEGGDG